MDQIVRVTTFARTSSRWGLRLSRVLRGGLDDRGAVLGQARRLFHFERPRRL